MHAVCAAALARRGSFARGLDPAGGALAFSEPEKSQSQIKDIVESAYDHGADMIGTPCPLCQRALAEAKAAA